MSKQSESNRKLGVRAPTRKSKMSHADIEAAHRLRVLWDAKAPTLGMTQSNFAGLTGVEWTQGAVSQYLNGQIPLSYRAVLTFAHALKVEPEVIRNDLYEQKLLGRFASMARTFDRALAPPPTTGDHFLDVNASSMRASMGGGTDQDEYAEAHKLKFRAESLRNKRLRAEDLKIYYGRGDSMEPTIADGAAIMYDTSKTKPEDDTVFVIWHDNRLFVKRLRVPTEGVIYIESDNKVGKWRKLIPVKPGVQFAIEGKVVWIANWMQV